MTDYISREAAVDALDEIESEIANGYGYQYQKWRKYFCELPSAQPEQRWIPCSDRFPENEDIYFVTFDKSNLLDNETQVSDAYWINNQWQYGVLESYEHRMPKLVIEPIEELKVIAWMPLPESYKGEEQ